MAVNYTEMNRSVLNAQINKIIKQLLQPSLNSNEIQGYSDQLYEIYSNNTDFRHEYSSISSTLVEAIQNWKPNNKKDLSLNTVLEANLFALKQDYMKRHPVIPSSDASENAMKQFRKLGDHITLETVRLNYMDEIKSDARYSKRFADEFSTTKKHVDKIERELDHSKSSYIGQVVTVLSIFAAIVLTFSGGLSLLGNGLTAIKDCHSPFRLLFLVVLFGLIMYNCIIGLMFIVCRMNQKDISVTCKESTDSCISCYHHKPGLKGFMCQAIHRYPHITIIECVFLYSLYLILLYGHLLLVIKTFSFRFFPRETGGLN